MKKTIIFSLFFALMLPAFAGDKHYRGILDFYVDVAKGNVPGHSSLNTTGKNAATAAKDNVWSGGGAYGFFPDTARAMVAISTAGADSIGGTGALTVAIAGLDSNWIEQADTVTMVGTDSVDLDGVWRRVFRASVVTAGASDTNAGDISIRVAGETLTGAFIAAGEGQTQQAIYTIPDGKTGYFVKMYMALSSNDTTNENGTFQVLTRLNGSVNSAWLVNSELGLMNTGSSVYQYQYPMPDGPLVEHTDIKIELSAASDTMITQAGFELLLVDD